MIKANELRIGNLVEYKITDKFDERKEWWEVSEIDADDIHWLSKVDTNDDDFKPIPLTENWLLKFGFEKDVNLQFFKNFKNNKTVIIGFGFICRLGSSHVKINYVHELQNLYFALTKTELSCLNLEK